MPNKYGNISEIAQYNRENGTNFYTMEQVEKHKRKNSAEEFEKKHPFLASLSKSAQEARDARIGAIGSEQIRDLYNKGENELASELNNKYLGANVSGILSAPMAGEFVTYGPLVGALRLGAGTAGSAAGSYVAGKAGDFADKKLRTNWIGDTGRLLGGFAGFGAGMKATTPLLQRATARNIRLAIPKETFTNLRHEGLSNEVARALNREIGTSDLTVPSSYFHNPNSAYRATTIREIADLSHTGTTRPSFKSKLADHDYSQGYQGWLKGDNYMEIVENSKNPFTKAKHSNLLGNEGVILETDGTGKLFRHGYHGSAGELEPFENIDTTPGELVTSGLAKGMYKKRNGGYGEAFTFKGLALGPEDPGISSDAISYFTRAGKGRWKYQGAVPKSKEITVEPTPKQTRVVSEGTYPLYTGPKHSVTEVVNPDGTVNPRAALRIEREVADNIPGAYRMESRLENPEWHVNDPNTWAHTRNVAQSAWTVPTPKGLTKQDQMVAALGHDFGKMVSGDGHAQSSAALIEQIFPDVTEQQLTAISEHMGAPKSILGKVTKQADILNGKPAITRFVGDNGKIRLRLPSHTVEKPRELVLDPQGNNKFRVHTRTWDGDHIPAEMSGEDKNTLFNALYEELPEGAEILFPESGPGNYATRGTVAGLQRLARDSRFKPTGNGVLQYIDKDGSIKTFEGTGFRKQQGGILKAEDGTKMIKYRQTENIAPEFEMPKIEGYKKQFSFKQPQGVKEEEIVIEEPEPEVKEEPEFSERELEVLQTDGTAQEKADVTNKYLQKRLGLTNEQAAALVGVWKAESGFNLNAENAEEKAGKSKYVKPTEYGIGIGQWTKSRHNDYVNYIKNNGGKNNLQTQLDFAIDEIQNKYSDYLNNLRTAENVQDATAYTYTQYVGGAERNIRDLDDLYARVRNMEQKYINAHRQIYGKAGSGNFDRRVRFATESLLAKLGTKLPDIRKPEA